MKVTRPVSVVRSATHLEIELLRHPTPEIEFQSRAQEEQYQSSDLALANQIESQILGLFPGTPAEQLLFTNLDWWPNKSRSIVLGRLAFSIVVLERLIGLLQGEYSDWRIHVTVVESLTSADQDEIGSLCILPKGVIIEQSLVALIEAAA
jgi:hypothetical protein